MKATLRYLGNVAVVDITGRITIGRGDVVLRDTLQGLIDGEEKRILLNMKGVTYMDSSGIGELIAAYKRATDQGCSIKILSPSDKVSSLLETMRFEEIFDTYENEDAAVSSF